MWCNAGFADILFKDCGSKKKDGTFRQIKEGRKHEYYVSFKDGKIYKTVVHSIEDVKRIDEFLCEGCSSILYPTGAVENIEFQLTFFDKNLITGKRLDKGTWENEPYYLFQEIFINLKENTIEYVENSDDPAAKKLIQIRKKIDENLSGEKNRLLKCISEKQEDSGSDSDSKGSGTAFFINNRGNLITNNHVVEGCKLSKINYFNKEYDTNLISTDKTLDLALLKVELKPKTFISFSNKEPRKRQTIIVAGYPLGEYLSDDLKINEGKISSLKGFENNSNEITVDLAINPGNSGGPIVDENGQLVAVAVAGMSKEVTEGISFGIKSSAVNNFLKTNKISPDIKPNSFSMNDEKVNQLLEESTVYIFCE